MRRIRLVLLPLVVAGLSFGVAACGDDDDDSGDGGGEETSLDMTIGVSLPLAEWIPDDAFNLNQNPYARLSVLAPRRSRCTLAPSWHRLRTPADVTRLDPGLEGWEETRALLGNSTAHGR